MNHYQIYVYVLKNCPICNVFKEKIKQQQLDYIFKYIDESEFTIKKINFTHLSFPQFFYIKNNKKILLDRTTIINKYLSQEIYNK